MREHCTYLKDVVKALSNVSPEYYEWIDAVKHKTASVERVFCYEFYHQFRKIMEENNNANNRYYHLLFNAEIGKGGFDEYKKIYPDFVLHMGQNCFESQKFAIEVKTSKHLNAKDFNKDIEKLFNLISTGTERKYELGIFICINRSYEDLVTFIRKKLNMDLLNKIIHKNKLNKIYCLSACIDKNNKNRMIKHFYLNDILN